MGHIIATAEAFPENYYLQEELLSQVKSFWSRAGFKERFQARLVDRFHRNAQVEGRHLALPMDAYERLPGFGARNDAWIKTALVLGEKAICDLLAKSGLRAEEISLLAFTTITGIAVPSIDARLMNRIPFASNLKRLPIFGLGCLGGAAGVARVADYLRGQPHEAAILLSVELCSLTIQHDDLSLANLVSSGLFGDGAAAVLMVGNEHLLSSLNTPVVIDSQSIFFPDSEHIMGWEVKDSGFKIVLSPDVSKIAEEKIRPGVETFLERHGLQIEDIQYWITHPGGPKVMKSIEEGLGLDREALQLSRKSLAKVGNVSSTSVLLVLGDTMAAHKPEPGTYGLMMAMGPAFCAELVLLQWQVA